MRVFYVLYPMDPRVHAWLNLLRFLANPHARFIAHLTVRGPYKQRYHMENAAAAIAGRPLTIAGVDAFMQSGQTTALLRCADDIVLRQIWRKPDYPGFNPHITICDGLPDEYTKKVLAALEGVTAFTFRATGLHPLVTKPAQADASLIRAINTPLVIPGSQEERLDVEQIQKADESLRLRWLKRVATENPTHLR